MKKLINNTVHLALNENEVSEQENGDYKIKAVVAHANVVNDNDLILDGDVIEFQRETYPFLFNHESSNLLGEVKTAFDAEQKAYISEITLYSTKQDIIKAIKNGVYDSVSISYYIDEYNFNDDNAIVIKHALMNEVSLVSVGADSEAKLIANELREDSEAKQLAENKLKEIKAKYE
ncbi:HK97 family phage prohead protease [Lactococcus laudensis]|uniref:HK97 family phage prohead protease n=1 Tax=Pseudolactococcus laudensis TaxID=1494461 RepID=UPI002FC5FD56